MIEALQTTQAIKPARSHKTRYPVVSVQVRVSASFAQAEVDWLNGLVSALLMQREADVRMLARHKAMALVARKARSMRAAIKCKTDARELEDARMPHRVGLTLQQSADLLGIASKQTVHRWIREGKLAGACHGRFGYRVHQSALDAFKQQHAELWQRTRRIGKRKSRSAARGRK